MTRKMFLAVIAIVVITNVLFGGLALWLKPNNVIPFPLNAVKTIYLPDAEYLGLTPDDSKGQGVVIKFICQKKFLGDKYWAIYDILPAKEQDSPSSESIH